MIPSKVEFARLSPINGGLHALNPQCRLVRQTPRVRQFEEPFKGRAFIGGD